MDKIDKNLIFGRIFDILMIRHVPHVLCVMCYLGAKITIYREVLQKAKIYGICEEGSPSGGGTAVGFEDLSWVLCRLCP